MTLYSGNGASGSTDGDVSAATYKSISSIAADKNGNIFVMQDSSIRVINTITAKVKTLQLKVTQCPFASPQGITVDQWDNVYVVNGGANVQQGGPNQGNGYILKITPDGTVSRFAGNQGVTNVLTGQAQSVSFDAPGAIFLLPSGDFLVSNSTENVIQKIATHKQ